jgi:hypothetical protein
MILKSVDFKVETFKRKRDFLRLVPGCYGNVVRDAVRLNLQGVIAPSV